MDRKNRNRPNLSSGRPRLPLSTYYRSGSQAAGEASPFESRINKVNPFKKYWLKTVDVALIIILAAVIVHSMIVKPGAKVMASTTAYHSLANYQDSANHYLRSFGNHNKITFNSGSLITSLKRDYPEISAASVELPVFSQTPVIRLQIAGPTFFLTVNGKQYLLDSGGRVVAPRSQYPEVKDLPTIIDQAGSSVTRGKQELSETDVSFIKAVIAEAGESNIKIKALFLPPIASELDLSTVDSPYQVKFYLAGDAATQIGQWLAARHNFAKNNITPAQYLDVRVAGKVFYK